MWDVGVQLSFAAALGLLLFDKPLLDAFRDLASHRLPQECVDRLAGPVGKYFLFTLTALQDGHRLLLVTALFLADAGSAPLNPPEWIARLNPQVVLLSVSAADKDGLPSPETLDAVKGYTLLRTDRNGANLSMYNDKISVLKRPDHFKNFFRKLNRSSLHICSQMCNC